MYRVDTTTRWQPYASPPAPVLLLRSRPLLPSQAAKTLLSLCFGHGYGFSSAVVFRSEA